MSAADDGAGHNVADELLRIDRLGADRRDRGIGDDPFDASTREGHESNELTARLHVGVAVERFRNGGESRHRAPDLVDEDGKALRVETRRHAAPRSPMRASAQDAASASTGSSDATSRSMLGRRAAPPTFPAAIRALRRSHRPSFFGT